jgi:aldehyde dehydrogenase (NAD+)
VTEPVDITSESRMRVTHSGARRFRTGALGVNRGAPYRGDMPHGGYEQSGIGRRSGTAGFEQRLETKAVGRPSL